MYFDLLLNLSLLVALTVVSTFFWRRFSVQQVSGAIIQGCLFGAAAVLGMMRPMVLEPGLIFDGRSMMLSLCALFFGPWAALASGLLAGLYRAAMGGPGVYMGVLTVCSSLAVGLWFHHRWRPRQNPPTVKDLFLFGVAVHVAMLAMTVALPESVRWSTLRKIALPVLVAYPLLTVLAGKILVDQAWLSRLLAELQQVNQRLEITLRSIADGVLATDLQGRVVTMNPTAEALTGWSANEARGRPIQEVFRIINEHTRQPVENPVQRVLREGRVVGLANHTLLLSRQGKEAPIADSAAPILDEQGRCQGVVLVFRDQTKEREARNALVESEARYRQLVESAPALVWYCDAQGNFDFFNQRWLDFRGSSLEEERGQGWTKGVHPEDWAACQQAFAQARQRREPWQASYRLQRHDGHYRWLHEEALPVWDRQGTFMGYIGFGLDITEQRELLERERLLISALEASTAGIFVADAGGFIEWVNPAFAAHLRLDREAAAGKHWEEFFISVTLGEVNSLEALLEHLLAGRSWRGELLTRRQSGEKFSAEATLSPVCNDRGQTVKVVGMFEDLTTRRAMEQKVQHAQKLDAIGLLASGVAHDFNNVLSVFIMNAELLADADNLTDDQKDSLTQMLTTATHGQNLTRQLLTFSRQQPRQIEELDLNAVVREFSRMLQRLTGENITLETCLHPEALYLMADCGMLEQVLMNLTVNARDAMPQGGRLVIETALSQVHGDLTFGDHLPEQGPYVRLTVRDNGCGMTPEVLPHIFEPFFTTKEPGKGTGLGLAVVQRLVNELQGGLYVESQLGRGTTFHLYFPATRCVLKPTPAKPEAELRGGTETILLVEDEASVREVTAKSLRKYGYTVLTAAHGLEALHVFAAHREKISLLLTDILMPGEMRGDELAGRLLNIKPSLKVIYMSGYPGEGPIARPDFFAGKVFLQKPFTPRQLARLLRMLLDEPAPNPQCASGGKLFHEAGQSPEAGEVKVCQNRASHS